MDKAVAAWAKRIRARMGKTIEGIVETGNVLADCKAALLHGQYLATLDLVGFNVRRAQKLTRIARNPILSDTSFFTHLTPCVESLYLLSRLDEEDLLGALKDGRVRPDTTIRDVQVLLAEVAERDRSVPRVNLKKPRPGSFTPVFETELVQQYCGDLRDILPKLPDKSVHALICDPPYEDKYAWMWGEIAEQAARLLVPGGSLLTLCGHRQMPFVVNTMSEYLDYWWVGGMGHGSSLQRLHGARVAVAFKPCLWFVKDFHRGPRTGKFPVDFLNGERDKRFHDWGQPVGWFGHWVERLTEPGECVLDPTSGAGTTVVAAAELGRRAVGVEIDITHCQTAAERVSSLDKDLPKTKPRERARRQHHGATHGKSSTRVRTY